LDARIVAAIDVFARGPVKPVVADDAVLIRIGAGKLNRMAGGRDREGVPMIAMRKFGTFTKDAPKAAVFGKIVTKSQEIVLTKLIDAHRDDQTRRFSLSSGGQNRDSAESDRQEVTQHGKSGVKMLTVESLGKRLTLVGGRFAHNAP
jgi:hypothetical protein